MNKRSRGIASAAMDNLTSATKADDKTKRQWYGAHHSLGPALSRLNSAAKKLRPLDRSMASKVAKIAKDAEAVFEEIMDRLRSMEGM